MSSVDGIHLVGSTNPPPTLKGGSLMPEDLSIDHVELLSTAASRWQVAVPDPSPVPGLFRLSADQAAALLLALKAMVTGSAVDAGYVFNAVDWPQPPVQVLKAVHAYEHLCGNHLHAWTGSVAQHLLAAVARAAMERLPGYSDASWVWHRSAAAAPVIGVAGPWQPQIPGLEWFGPDVDPQSWLAARAVVVTAESWELLPPTLADRDDVYVLAGASDDFPDVWDGSVGATYRLTWPLCEAFLTELVAGGGS